MKGIIFKAFEGFVTETWGEDFFERLLETARPGSAGAYVSPGTYPDEELYALVAAAVDRLDIPLDAALQAFGRYAFGALAASMPGLLRTVPDAPTLLRMVDGVIHVEVRKLYPQAATPRILFEPSGPRGGRVVYESPRRLCPLLVGLMVGLGDHYGTPLDYRETACTRQGAEHCEFEVKFS